MGEQLYSARGSQSAGISEYWRTTLNLDVFENDSTFIVDILSKKYGNRFFELRPAFSLTGMMQYDFKRTLFHEQDIVVSIPLFCKMAGISINELEYEQFNLKLKP